ncbi:MAG TPA: hypothetical protein PLS50_06325, partial [Candidatus Dojkabacteria bacterium]|nr:hypothetical protein [Candidatus Dojkabacteria bacterium]
KEASHQHYERNKEAKIAAQKIRYQRNKVAILAKYKIDYQKKKAAKKQLEQEKNNTNENNKISCQLHFWYSPKMCFCLKK